MARKIPTASRKFESFLNKIDTTMPANPITINELMEVFFLKNKQNPDYDEITSVIKNCFGELNHPLKYQFEKSIKKELYQML